MKENNGEKILTIKGKKPSEITDEDLDEAFEELARDIRKVSTEEEMLKALEEVKQEIYEKKYKKIIENND